MNNQSLTSLTLITLSVLSVGKVTAADNKPMNVIFIMSDDHTSQAIVAYGSRLSVLNPTPTIDALAAD